VSWSSGWKSEYRYGAMGIYEVRSHDDPSDYDGRVDATGNRRITSPTVYSKSDVKPVPFVNSSVSVQISYPALQVADKVFLGEPLNSELLDMIGH